MLCFSPCCSRFCFFYFPFCKLIILHSSIPHSLHALVCVHNCFWLLIFAPPLFNYTATCLCIIGVDTFPLMSFSLSVCPSSHTSQISLPMFVNLLVTLYLHFCACHWKTLQSVAATVRGPCACFDILFVYDKVPFLIFQQMQAKYNAWEMIVARCFKEKLKQKDTVKLILHAFFFGYMN